MKPNPRLIPRFNIDYTFVDLVTSLLNLRKSTNHKSMNDIFNSSVIFTNSGRMSLYLILKGLCLPEKSKIGIPLYSCPSNFDSIIYAGHVPVFLDVDLDNLTLDPMDLQSKIHDLDVIVVIHTFGRPADMDEIMCIAGDVPVIEDCAHALLSKYGDSLLGTMGTAGYFSFRSGKYISAGEGGMIVTSNKRLMDNIRAVLQNYSNESMIGEIKHAFKTYLRSALYHRPWFGLVSLPIGSLVEKKVDIMNKYSFKVQNIRKTDLITISTKMLLFPQNVEKQRSNSSSMLKSVNCSLFRTFPEKKDTFCNYFLFPLVVQSKNTRDSAVVSLKREGVDTTQLFSNVPLIAMKKYGYMRDCPNTEYLCERILTVPNHYTLKEKELESIIKHINNFCDGSL
ncbi:DegT/DnrJ/EryC1/StrS family aminotransferase [uncultured Methanolobus sp.]|uniref:DegT/DnrJ/EryC1/StrS family aminotransferase n=1 Tax=uncultured Methanolobus sp. TaxID=218300 RepID=UPI002AAB1FCC|nr:DegT/DnrJ/EryC1/StrS family aminotransferase [uncultured Methanolobus sp.]